MSADWMAPKLRHATILIKTDPVSWCDATRRDAARRVRCDAASRHESTFTTILGIQRVFSRVFVKEREFARRDADYLTN